LEGQRDKTAKSWRPKLQGHSSRFSSRDPGVRAEYNSSAGVVIHGTSVVIPLVALGRTILSSPQVPASRHETNRCVCSPLGRAERGWQPNVTTPQGFCGDPETVQTSNEALLHRVAQGTDCLVCDKTELRSECRHNFDRWTRIGVGGQTYLKYSHGQWHR